MVEGVEMALMVKSDDGGRVLYRFWCFACARQHEINDTWEVSDGVNGPTVNPSVRVRSGNEAGETVCHFFIRDGTMVYCEDSTHKWAGHIQIMADLD